MSYSEHPAAIAAFQARFGELFTTNVTLRAQHANTQTWLPNEPAEGVLFATDKQIVIDAVKLCYEHRCPIIPFGTGTSLEGISIYTNCRTVFFRPSNCSVV